MTDFNKNNNDAKLKKKEKKKLLALLLHRKDVFSRLFVAESSIPLNGKKANKKQPLSDELLLSVHISSLNHTVKLIF